MFLLSFCRKWTPLELCKSIESAIQWFQMHHIITLVTIHNSAVNLSGARVSIFLHMYLGSPTIVQYTVEQPSVYSNLAGY